MHFNSLEALFFIDFAVSPNLLNHSSRSRNLHAQVNEPEQRQRIISTTPTQKNIRPSDYTMELSRLSCTVARPIWTPSLILQDMWLTLLPSDVSLVKVPEWPGHLLFANLHTRCSCSKCASTEGSTDWLENTLLWEMSPISHLRACLDQQLHCALGETASRHLFQHIALFTVLN